MLQVFNHNVKNTKGDIIFDCGTHPLDSDITNIEGNVRINCMSGIGDHDIVISNVIGDVHITLGVGTRSISVEDVSGGVMIDTGDGDQIAVNIKRVGEVHVRTGSFSNLIGLDITDVENGDVSIITGEDGTSGAIAINIINVASGSVTMTTGNASNDIVLNIDQANDGDVSITTGDATGSGARIDIDTSNVQNGNVFITTGTADIVDLALMNTLMGGITIFSGADGTSGDIAIDIINVTKSVTMTTGNASNAIVLNIDQANDGDVALTTGDAASIGVDTRNLSNGNLKFKSRLIP